MTPVIVSALVVSLLFWLRELTEDRDADNS